MSKLMSLGQLIELCGKNKKFDILPTKLTKRDVLKSLTTGLQQLSFEDEVGNVVYTASTKQIKNGVEVECTDGTRIELILNNMD